MYKEHLMDYVEMYSEGCVLIIHSTKHASSRRK